MPEWSAMPLSDIAYPLGVLLVALALIYVLLPLYYRRGRQVEYRIGNGSGTGRVLGMRGVKLRVRSLHSGNEHTVALTHVRRR
jgi:hypothetical protein